MIAEWRAVSKDPSGLKRFCGSEPRLLPLLHRRLRLAVVML